MESTQTMAQSDTYPLPDRLMGASLSLIPSRISPTAPKYMGFPEAPTASHLPPSAISTFRYATARARSSARYSSTYGIG